ITSIITSMIIIIIIIESIPSIPFQTPSSKTSPAAERLLLLINNRAKTSRSQSPNGSGPAQPIVGCSNQSHQNQRQKQPQSQLSQQTQQKLQQPKSPHT